MKAPEVKCFEAALADSGGAANEIAHFHAVREALGVVAFPVRSRSRSLYNGAVAVPSDHPV
jgi:hypothetical protein